MSGPPDPELRLSGVIPRKGVCQCCSSAPSSNLRFEALKGSKALDAEYCVSCAANLMMPGIDRRVSEMWKRYNASKDPVVLVDGPSTVYKEIVVLIGYLSELKRMAPKNSPLAAWFSESFVVSDGVVLPKSFGSTRAEVLDALTKVEAFGDEEHRKHVGKLLVPFLRQSHSWIAANKGSLRTDTFLFLRELCLVNAPDLKTDRSVFAM